MLVDLVFTNSGWRRLGIVGKTQKTLDLDLELPSTGERAFVQVKSNTTSEELAKYVNKLEHPYTRMFYVFHSGEAETADRRVTESLAKLVVDAGLVNWLIHKVS
jgi:porphobilinogen deaminase